jgi:biotin carboxyl carrier protein
MKLTAFLGDEEHEIRIREIEEHRFTLSLGEKTFEVDARAMEGRTWSLLIDGKSYEVDVEPDPDGSSPDRVVVRLRGSEFPMEVLDERRLRLREAAGGFAVEGPVTVKAPMPGKVVRCLVAEGDAVEEGAGVIVVEAMKMENELRAPKAGTVAELPVAEGQLVEGGTVLAVIE